MSYLHHVNLPKWIIAIAIVFFSINLKSQNELFIQFVTTTTVLPYFSEDEIRNSNSLILNIVAQHPDPTAKYVLRMDIYGPGIHLVSMYSDNTILDFYQGGQLTLFSADLAPYFDLEQMQFEGLTKDEYRRYGLPDGSYRVCFQIMDVAFDRAEKASNSSCRLYQVKRQLPPKITYPKSNHVIDLSLPCVFTWNHQVTTGEIIQYEFSMYEFVEEISTEELLVYYQPVIREQTIGKHFAYHRNRTELKPGKKYLAFARAIQKGPQVNFQNGGYSPPVIVTTKYSSDKSNRSAGCPTLSCDFSVHNGQYDIIVGLTGNPPGSIYNVYLDNILLGSSSEDPIIIPNVAIGEHIIGVAIPDICIEECTVNVVSECQPGLACDDNDPCTSGELYDIECACVGGTDTEVVTIEIGDPVNHFTCDYCVDLLPSTYGNYESFSIEQIILTTYWGYKILLDASDNGLTDFHFPYQIEDLGISAIELLRDDLNHWLLTNGHQGSVEAVVSYGPPCLTQLGLHFTDVNIGFTHSPIINAISNTNEPIEIDFNKLSCDQTSQIVGYYITPVLDEPTTCLLYSGNVVWSGGLPFDGVTVFTNSLENCYEVSVTCEEVCVYTAVGPGTSCECTVGTPCEPVGTSNPCLIYEFDANCDCLPIDPDFPDTDNDGVCDLVDICPGFDDFVDADGDMVPDGCDLCPCGPGPLDEGQIALLTDNDPTNDGNICNPCPCDDEVEIVSIPVGQAECDYCLQADPNTIPLSETQFVSSYTYRDQDGIHTVSLLDQWAVLNTEDFEDEAVTWQSTALPNGDYCDRFEDPLYASSGVYSMRLWNGGIHAKLTSPEFNFEEVCMVKMSFSFISTELDNTIDKFVLLESINGSGFSLVQEWEYSTDFINDNRQNIEIYLASSQASNIRYQFFANVNNAEDVIYLDDVSISALYSESGDCVSTELISNLTSFLTQEIYAHNYVGDVSYDPQTGECGTGSFISISNSTMGFESISFLGSEGNFTVQINSLDCGELYPGQELFEIQALSSCEQATYLWSSGETTSTILVPSLHGGYIVTINCDDGCEYIETFGNQNCLIGTPCTIANDPCYEEGTIDAYCNCIPNELPDEDEDGIPDSCDDCPFPPDQDSNQNGILDCRECTCEQEDAPYLTLIETPSETPANLCKSCFPVTLDPGQQLLQVVMTNPGATYALNSLPGFDFPYCATLNDNVACIDDRPSLSQFRRDFVAWAYEQGWEVRMVYDPDYSGPSCTGPKFIIENLKGETSFTLTFKNLQLTGSFFDCTPDPDASIISLELVVPTACVACSTITNYEWSDPSIGENVTIISPVDPVGGYVVTLTCSTGCQFIVEWEGDCLVGTPCNDLNACTENDHYNEHCFCEGEIGVQVDSDDDGVLDQCDKCDGFLDYIDDDHDDIPNGCDECMGYDDALLHDSDPSNDPENCITCELLELPLYTSSVYLGGWSGCGVNSTVNVFGFYYFFPGSNTSTYIQFSAVSGFQTRYCVSGNCTGAPTALDMAADIKTWLLAQGDNPDVLSDVMTNTYSVQHSIFKLEKLQYSCGISPNFKNFSNTTESETLPIPSPCDDGDPCTINDYWNEQCRCVGVLLDSDGDSVPDCDDECDGHNDMWDENDNDVPDGCETVLFECEEDVFISYCQFYTNLLQATEGGNPVVVREDMLSTISYDPKVISLSLRDATTELRDLMIEVDWEPYNFPYPDLISQLQSLASDLNGIPNFIDPFYDDATDGFLTEAAWLAFCNDNMVSQERKSLVARFCFLTVNDISDPSDEGYCYMDGIASTIEVYPGCATALDIDVYEDENCTLRRVDTDCAIEFFVNCYGVCDFRIIVEIPPVSEECGGPEPTVGPPCLLTPEICYLDNLSSMNSMPCAEWQVVPNPDYNITTNPGVPTCLCEAITISIGENVSVTVGDIDNDDVCDDIDQCPDEDDDSDNNDDPDNDDDGIHDCHDNCPDFSGTLGKGCNDNDPLTFGDIVQLVDANIPGICECKGHYIDWDGDGIPEFEDCDIVIDDDGDGYPDSFVDLLTVVYDGSGLIIDMVSGPDGLPDCDVCPGLDDTDMINGMPVCLKPPYTPIGCPESFKLINGEGVLLVYDATEVKVEDVPQPISLMYELVISGSHPYVELNYLLYTDIRETAGKVEVFYPAESLVYQNEQLGIVSITYAEHQQCIFTDHEPDMVSLGCPDEIDYYLTTDDLVLTFNTATDLIVDPSQLEGGEISFHLISDSEVDLTDPTDPAEPITLTYNASQVNQGSEPGEITITFPIDGLGVMDTYSGTIEMLSQELMCEIDGGGLVTICEDIYGEPIAIGEPCDDQNPCTDFDAWGEVDGVCTCIGQPKPDTDGDGICDDLDPGLSDLHCPSELSSTSTLATLVFDTPLGFHIDPHAIGGEFIFEPNGSAPVSMQLSIEHTYTVENTLVAAMVSNGLNVNSFNGLLTLPNGVVCQYTGGAPEECSPGIVNGSPCEDGLPCTHHDKYVDCICVGEFDNSSDSDGDGVCDAIDPCPNNDCPCPEFLIIQDDPEEPGEQWIKVINGNEVEVMLVEDEEATFDHINIHITGGEEDINLMNLPFSNPVIIPNLPYGYYYVITITGVCLNGEEKEVDFDIPLEEGQFVCGIEIKDIDLSTQNLLPILEYGDVFTASDFDITVKNAKGNFGKFTGSGYIKIPYFQTARINVSFQNIVISADMQMIQGVINVNGFGLAVLGDTLSDIINEGINDILDVLDDIDEILDQLIPVLEAIDELIAQTGQMVPPDIQKCLEDAKKALQVYLNTNPDKSLPATKEKILELTEDIEDCMVLYNDALAKILNGLIELIPAYFASIANDPICDQQVISQLYNATNQAYKPQFDINIQSLYNNWISGQGGGIFLESNIKTTEILAETSFPEAELNEYFIDKILRIDYCNAAHNLNSGFLDPNLTPQQLASRIKVFTSLLLEFDSKVIESLGKDISSDNNIQELLNEYSEPFDKAFKNILIKKAYKN